jgi:hypothetical protein
MAARRGAPRLIDREDPLSFVLRNRSAREVLERLSGQPLMVPLQVRKDVGVHPETFRRLLSDLDEFALISVRSFPRRRPVHPPRAMALRLARGIQLTRQGENVLELAREVREAVRRRAPLLPESSTEHWLSAQQQGPHGDLRTGP